VATTQSIKERFWAKVYFPPCEDDCWTWTATLRRNGYGSFHSGGRTVGSARTVKAHRVAYELMIGPIPKGMTLDHLCRNRACVNPKHLEPVTSRVNILRGVGLSAVNAVKTHCPQGHEYTPENTRLYRGRRYCRACARYVIESKSRARAKAAEDKRRVFARAVEGWQGSFASPAESG
jgi:hypothetical protein